MSVKYVPPFALSPITSAGVLFAPESFYKTPLSSTTELFNLLTASSVTNTLQNTPKISVFYIQYCNVFNS